MRIRWLTVHNFRGIRCLSWQVGADFNCIIGAGDTCKTTILTALDYALSPRTSLTFDDTDFYNQDVDRDILIQVTLSDWDEESPGIRGFFQESKFARYKCGLGENGPLPEPDAGGRAAVSVSLRVDKSLEPKWSVVKGPDEGQDEDRRTIYAADRAILGISRVDLLSDFHFTWGRNTILTRLSSEAQGDLNAVLSALARDMRRSDISGHESVAGCQGVADAVRQEARAAGVNLSALGPKIDLQRQSMTSGAMSLHEDAVPLRNKGAGSKKLIAAAMQMKLHGGKNIALIDELEVGLEPHRIRGLIHRLRHSPQQIFATSHSPVAIRELDVAANELHVCKRSADGTVTVQSLDIVPDIQGPVRSNAEAFLGSRIVACEGPTEIGLIRAYDGYRFGGADLPVWSLATAFLDCGGAAKIKEVCPQLVQLGYHTALLCDNDAPEHLSDADITRLRGLGAHVCQWEQGNSTEHQLFADMPWEHVPRLLGQISTAHDPLELATMIDLVRREPRLAAYALPADPAEWPDDALLRRVIGELANKGKWIKRIAYAEPVFAFALPFLANDSVMKMRLRALWNWIQGHDR